VKFPLPSDTKTVADQLAAVERLRANTSAGRAIANGIIFDGSDHLGIGPDPEIVEALRQRAAKCLAVLGQPQT